MPSEPDGGGDGGVLRWLFCCEPRDKTVSADVAGVSWGDTASDSESSETAARKSVQPALLHLRDRKDTSIGVPAEIEEGECRVAVVPAGVRALREAGFSVLVESGAGSRAGFTDDSYRAAGATVCELPDQVFEADVVMKVRAPAPNAALGRHEVELLSRGKGVLVCALDPDRQGPLISRLEEHRVLTFSITRTDRGGPFDVSAATANVAGYHGVLEAATRLQRPFGVAKVLVLGCGAAAVSAARTAAGLGASVRVAAWKCPPPTRESLEKLGCSVSSIDPPRPPGASADVDKARESIAALCTASNVVVSAAGDGALHLIPEAAVRRMAAGSVVVDIAAGAGGDVEAVSAPVPGVHLYRMTDLHARRAQESAEAWSNCVVAFALHLTPPGDDDGSRFGINLASPQLRRCAVQGTSDAGVVMKTAPRRTHRRWLRRRQIPFQSAGADEEDEEEITWWGVVMLAEPEWPLISCGLFLTVLKVPFSLAVPHFTAAAAAALFHKQRGPAMFAVKAWVVCAVAELVIGTTAGLVAVAAQQRVVRRVRCELFDNLVRQEAAFFDAVPTGALASRLEVDTAEMASELNWIFSSTLDSICRIAGIGVYMMVFSPGLAAITLCAIPFTGVLTLVFSKLIRENKMKLQGDLAHANDVSAEVFSQSATVSNSGTTAYEGRRYTAAAGSVFQTSMRQAYYDTSFSSSTDAVFLVSSAMVLIAGVEMVMVGEITAKEVIVFTSYQGQFRSSVLNLFDVVSSLARSVGAGARVWKLMHRQPAECARSLPDAVFPEAAHGSISVRDVEFTYASRPDAPVLRGVSFEVPAGATVAIVGASGSGKSTLSGLLKRRYDVDSGEIRVDGVPLTMLAPAWVQQRVALVEQEPALLSGTVAHNILYPALSERPDLEECMEDDEMLRAKWMAKVRCAAERSGAAEFIDRLPDGFATEVGERGAALSGGQKQRIAIARALVMDPCLLVLDEATSALDADSEASVTASLSEHGQSTTMLVIAQRLSTVRKADLIIVMHNGVVVEQGTHEVLKDKPPAADCVNYRRLLDSGFV
eukprot:TRINITY_DN5158_c0_g1_i1.p1 TRINITY_DN5158_c0_g1~~TRINITY_DN5158_c0_g1_i1.p1  ORF type:complete len:1047 (+),score=387.79 TRINITY_DN5158_c0_g1_i1:76-3216(+)